MMKAECASRISPGRAFVRLPLRGQRKLGVAALSGPNFLGPIGVDSPLLPVELQHVNHTASTNGADSTRSGAANPTIRNAMSDQTQIDQISERVERLLLRYEELQRTNALLSEQVGALTHDRDSLRSRLSAARARVDALLERLPENYAPASSSSRA